jgi:uncharacterized low-complexity protein
LSNTHIAFLEKSDMADKTFLTGAIGTLTAASFSLGAIDQAEAANDLFQAEPLDQGFMAGQASFGEGACGEGSCGEGNCGEKEEEKEEKEEEKEEEKSEEGACGEGRCGEGACGEGSCGEGSCGST